MTRGDGQALVAEALERYERPLLRYAHRLVGDLEAARDIVQDTFLRLCRQAPETVESYLGQWLYTVCRHRAVDHLRKDGRMKTLDDIPLPAPHRGAEDRAEHHEASSQLAALLERLPARQQEVVRLKFESGLSYREISAITKASVSNVGFLLHTALKTLRAEMKKPLSQAAGEGSRS